jgi:RimJ/RimL family protein N-acetyltransferase
MSDGGQQVRIDVRGDIRLTEIRAADKAAFVEHLNDVDIYRATLRVPHPYSESDADVFLAICAEAAAKHGHPVHFAIRQDDGRLIGACGFDGIVYDHKAEIGYWLAKPCWGRGIMTDVVRAACDFAVRQWKLMRITAHVLEFNQASARVLEKNGFHFEGLLRRHHRKNGRLLDSRLYALLP